MRKVCTLFLVLFVTGLADSSRAATVEKPATPPEEAVFKKVRAGRTLRLQNCPVIPKVNYVKVVNGGRYLQLPPAKKRGLYKLRTPYNWLACADGGDGSYAIYGKKKPLGEVTSYKLSLKDFPRSAISLHCPSVRSWPGHLIYKTVGSGHFFEISFRSG